MMTSILEFARFEIRCHEIERARVIFKYGLDKLMSSKEALRNEYTLFEKQYGSTENIEDVIISKRKEQYEAILKESPFNYDVWFDYLKMLEQDGKEDEVIKAYERAITNVPPSKEKRFWRRYIYFWIYYAVYLELDVDEIEKARDVYKRCIQCIPNKSFTFGKVKSSRFLSRADLDSVREVRDPPQQPGQGAQGAFCVSL